MKRISIIITLLIGLVIVLGSCKKETKDPVLNLSAITAPTITSPASESAFILTLADSAVMIDFAWNTAVYNVSDGAVLPTPTYSLRMGLADSNFVGSMELVNTKDATFSIMYYTMNTKLLQMGVAAEETVTIEFKLTSVISGTIGTETTSEIIACNFTTFNPPGPPPSSTPTLWVPGDYQGWNPGAAPNVFSPANNGIYTGYVYYPEGGTYEFKFTSAPDWNHTNFGFAGEGTLDTDPGAGNLSVPDFGNYWLTCDTIALTWSHELRTFTLIGSFNDWAGDEDLTWDNDNRLFTITMDFDAGTEFKWRVNADWAINLGDSGNGDNTLSQDGANIVLEDDGNYTLNLYLEKEVPTYEVIKN